MLFFVKAFDAIASIFVLAELCLVFVRIKLGLVVPFSIVAFKDVD